MSEATGAGAGDKPGKAPEAGGQEVAAAAAGPAPGGWKRPLVCTLLIFLALMGWARYQMQRVRMRSALRGCYANQKTLDGVATMWELDGNVPLTRFDEATMARLGESGYLASTPWDPGYGAGSHSHYELLPDPPGGVMCIRHGWLGEPLGTTGPRELLQRFGVTDPARLAAAAVDARDNGPGIAGAPLGAAEAFATGVFLVLAPIFGGLLSWAIGRLMALADPPS